MPIVTEPVPVLVIVPPVYMNVVVHINAKPANAIVPALKSQVVTEEAEPNVAVIALVRIVSLPICAVFVVMVPLTVNSTFRLLTVVPDTSVSDCVLIYPVAEHVLPVRLKVLNQLGIASVPVMVKANDPLVTLKFGAFDVVPPDVLPIAIVLIDVAAIVNPPVPVQEKLSKVPILRPDPDK